MILFCTKYDRYVGTCSLKSGDVHCGGQADACELPECEDKE